MKKPFKLLNDKITALGFVSGLILNILLWIAIFLFIKPTHKLIPLHYTIYFGIDRLGQWYEMFFLPALGLIIFFINYFFANLFYQREKLVSYFLAIIFPVTQIIMFLSAIFLIIYT